MCPTPSTPENAIEDAGQPKPSKQSIDASPAIAPPPPPSAPVVAKTTFQFYKQSAEFLKISKLLNELKNKFNTIKMDFLMSADELKSHLDEIQSENIKISTLINSVAKESERAALLRTQNNITAEIKNSVTSMNQRSQIEIPTQIQLSTIDFTQMQNAAEPSQLSRAVKLARADIMDTSQRCFHALPKDSNELMVMDFDGTLNIEQGDVARGLFGGEATQTFIQNNAERFYILTGGAGEDPARAYENLSPAMSHIAIDVKNEHIVSTGTSMTGLKGNFLAQRLYANQQIGANNHPLNITFLDDGINNHVPFIRGIIEEILKISATKGNAFILPAAIEFNCIWVKRPDDNPHAGTDNSHGEVGRLRTLFGAPNPQDMESEAISDVTKADIIVGSEFNDADFRKAIKELENQIHEAPRANIGLTPGK